MRIRSLQSIEVKWAKELYKVSERTRAIADARRSCWICGEAFVVGDGMTVMDATSGSKLVHSRCYLEQAEIKEEMLGAGEKMENSRGLTTIDEMRIRASGRELGIYDPFDVLKLKDDVLVLVAEAERQQRMLAEIYTVVNDTGDLDELLDIFMREYFEEAPYGENE